LARGDGDVLPAPLKEVEDMIGVEGVFVVESLTGSLVAAALILAMLVAGVAYGSLPGKLAHRRIQGQPLKKAA
jgi:hypothetical protein